jgi:hypothetical protein
MPGIDFNALRQEISMQQVLDLCELASGPSRVGRCNRRDLARGLTCSGLATAVSLHAANARRDAKLAKLQFNNFQHF